MSLHANVDQWITILDIGYVIASMYIVVLMHLSLTKTQQHSD